MVQCLIMAEIPEKLTAIFDEYFLPNELRKDEIVKATCKHCQAKISGKTNITSNFVKHIQVNK